MSKSPLDRKPPRFHVIKPDNYYSKFTRDDGQKVSIRIFEETEELALEHHKDLARMFMRGEYDPPPPVKRGSGRKRRKKGTTGPKSSPQRITLKPIGEMSDHEIRLKSIACREAQARASEHLRQLRHEERHRRRRSIYHGLDRLMKNLRPMP